MTVRSTTPSTDRQGGQRRERTIVAVSAAVDVDPDRTRRRLFARSAVELGRGDASSQELARRLDRGCEVRAGWRFAD